MPSQYNFKSPEHHCDRCCNPYNLTDHNRTQSLRRLSKNQVEIFPEFTRDHYVCNSCRKKIKLSSQNNVAHGDGKC